MGFFKNEDSTRRALLKGIESVMHASSIHALPNIVRNRYISIKIMWIISFLGSMSYCFYSINEAVSEYNKYPVISTTRDDYINPITFPIVTICNMNYFSTDYAKTLMNTVYNFSSITENANFSKRMNLNNHRLSAISFASYLPEADKYQLGNTLNKILISCMFNNIDCDLINDFEAYFDPLYGNCFKFNADESKYSSTSGSIHGLRLELLNEATDTNENLYSVNNGFYIFLTNQSNFNSFDFDGIKISNGYATNILLAKSTTSRKPKPYSDCTDDLTKPQSYPSTVYALSFKLNNQIYRRSDCLNMCYQIYIGAKCGCYDIQSGVFPNKKMKACITGSELTCQYNIRNYYLDNNLLSSCDCPFECSKTDYSYTASIADYPTKFYSEFLMANPSVVDKFGVENTSEITYDYMRKRLSAVNIFYNQLQETVIKEGPKQTVSDLIANIGGILALFLGISFLSFVEFAEIFLQSLFIISENKKVGTSK